MVSFSTMDESQLETFTERRPRASLAKEIFHENLTEEYFTGICLEYKKIIENRYLFLATGNKINRGHCPNKGHFAQLRALCLVIPWSGDLPFETMPVPF